MFDQSERPHTYKQWTEELMKVAFSRVMDNELSIREASAKYNIPYTTLCDRVSGRRRFHSHSGPPRHLTLRASQATLVNKNFLPLSATGDFSQHEERAAYRHVKHWPLSALVT